MSKRLAAMRANPLKDWRIADIEALCAQHDVHCVASRAGSSHYRISHPLLAEKLTIPFKRPIKPVYIKKLVAFIDRLQNAQS